MSDNNEALDSIIEFSEDLSTAEAPEPLPVRDYNASVIGAEAKTSSTSGKRYLALKVLVRPEEYPADYPADNAPEGTTLSYNRLSLEDLPATRYRMRLFLEELGIAPSKRLDLNELVHRECRVSITHEMWDGLKRAVVEKITRA